MPEQHHKVERTPFQKYVLYTFSDEVLQIDVCNDDIHVVNIGEPPKLNGALLPSEAKAIIKHNAFPMVAGFFTIFQDRISALKALKSELEKLGLPLLPDPTLLQSYKNSDIQLALASAAHGLLNQQAELISKLVVELYQLRRDLEESQISQAAFASFLRRRNLRPYQLVFATEPCHNPRRWVEMHPRSIDEISQTLPMSSDGLAAVAVNLNIDQESSCSVTIVLETMEDGAVRGRWNLERGSIRSGWNILSLSRSLGGLRRTLRLRFQAHGEGRPVKVSLGELQPIERFRVAGPADVIPISDHHLAFMAWTSLPSLAFSEAPTPLRQTEPNEIVLRESALSSVRAFCLTSSAQIQVETDLDRGAITIRPKECGCFATIIPRAVSSRSVRISARVTIAKEFTSGGYVSIRIAPSLTEVDGHVYAQDITSIALSEYVSINPGLSKIVNLFIPTALEEVNDVAIAVRVLDKNVNDTTGIKISEIVVFSCDRAAG